MFSKKIIVSGFVAAMAFSAASSFAAMGTLANGKSLSGQPASEAQVTRVVDATMAKNLNVRCGETVTFVNGTQKFSWKFDSVNHASVPLASIAPAGFGQTGQQIYVGMNEGERGG